MDPYSTKQIGTSVPCGHCYHADCFHQWECSSANRGIHLKCPLCKRHSKSFCRIYLEPEQISECKDSEHTRRLQAELNVKRLETELRSSNDEIERQSRRYYDKLYIIKELEKKLSEEITLRQQIENEHETLNVQYMKIKNELVESLQTIGNCKNYSNTLILQTKQLKENYEKHITNIKNKTKSDIHDAQKRIHNMMNQNATLLFILKNKLKKQTIVNNNSGNKRKYNNNDTVIDIDNDKKENQQPIINEAFY
jgi:hypothetical protein